MKIVLVCIGQYQSYITECVGQLVLWGNMDITILTDTGTLQQQLINHLPNTISVRVVNPNHCHELFHFFEAHSRLSHGFRNGFFRHCFKRFIYLCEYMKETGITDIIHFENDIMVYRNTDDWKSFLSGSEIALVMDSMNRCIPSVMYFKNSTLLEECLSRHIDPDENDMEFWAKCQRCYPEKILNLPILFESPGIPKEYYEHYTSKIGIFDGAAIGQYLGGVNPENDDKDTRGFINETCVVRYDQYKFSWKQDPSNHLWRPMMLNQDFHWVLINNLHIHSKTLHHFNSMPICLERLEHKLCTLLEHDDDSFSNHAFQKYIHHFFYFNKVYGTNHDFRKIRRPIWNLPIISVHENEFEIFIHTHHVYIRRPFVLICQNNRVLDISEKDVRMALDRPNCTCIFMQIPSIRHHKMHVLPIGVSKQDSRMLRQMIYEMPFKHLKKRFLYCPFHMIPNDSIAELKEMVDPNDDDYLQNRDDYKSYLQKLSEYQYCICYHSEPHEFYRLVWDCVRMQVIPIVKNCPSIQSEIDPIIVVERWKDIPDATTNYTFPNYPLFDSELYKEKIFQMINA